MTHELRIFFLAIALSLLAGARLGAQGPVVWPGDVTGNGRVNNLDLLYLGLAYNYVGPARPNATVQFEAQPAPAWSQQFPNGANLALADADGNGLVNYYYDFFPLFVHYGLERPDSVTADTYVPGAPGFDPLLTFVDTSVQDGVHASESFKLPLVFGTPDLPVEDLYGLAFSVSVDPAYIDARDIEFDLQETSWANPDNDRIYLQKAVSDSQIDVGWVRTDHNQRSGHGRLGEATIIIVDVVGVQATTPVVFHSIRMIDKFGNEIPVAGDTIVLTILPDPLATGLPAEALAKGGPRLAPNPAHDYLRYAAAEPVESIALYNAIGQRAFSATPGQSHGTVPLDGVPPGVYFAEIRTRKQVFVRTVAIE